MRLMDLLSKWLREYIRLWTTFSKSSDLATSELSHTRVTAVVIGAQAEEVCEDGRDAGYVRHIQ